jgi:pimeloyl-ACP methyl ester carboxylesterase
MKSIQQSRKSLQAVVLASVVFLGTFGSAMTAAAQELRDLQTPKSPLVLKALGSFYVGGETISQTATEIGLYGGGQLVVNQMYVQYMIPQGNAKMPLVMVHGATLSGKTYETTPDGRMGWAEYFVRKGHPTYVADQVARARSGFNQAVYNNVRAGIVPPDAQPSIQRVAIELAWVRFRFGPAFGVKFPDTQFPVEAAELLAKQGVPDFNASLPLKNPTYQALSDLAIELKGAVLLAHSQGGRFPFEAALISSTRTKGLVAIEPAGCSHTLADPTSAAAAAYSDEQIAKLAKVPILVVFGDHLEAPQTYGVPWLERFNDCKAFITRVNAAGGNAQMLYPPDFGIHGNTHMIMQDKNNLEIADLILKWINKHV